MVPIATGREDGFAKGQGGALYKVGPKTAFNLQSQALKPCVEKLNTKPAPTSGSIHQSHANTATAIKSVMAKLL